MGALAILSLPTFNLTIYYGFRKDKVHLARGSGLCPSL
jgi:hypothetical protein